MVAGAEPTRPVAVRTRALAPSVAARSHAPTAPASMARASCLPAHAPTTADQHPDPCPATASEQTLTTRQHCSQLSFIDKCGKEYIIQL